jgi:hypothetical protein
MIFTRRAKEIKQAHSSQAALFLFLLSSKSDFYLLRISNHNNPNLNQSLWLVIKKIEKRLRGRGMKIRYMIGLN